MQNVIKACETPHHVTKGHESAHEAALATEIGGSLLRRLTAKQREAVVSEDAAFRRTARWASITRDPGLIDRMPFFELREAAWLACEPYGRMRARLRAAGKLRQKKKGGKIYVMAADVIVRRKVRERRQPANSR